MASEQIRDLKGMDRRMLLTMIDLKFPGGSST